MIDLPIGVVRSRPQTNVSRAIHQGVNMIRYAKSATNTPILSQESQQSNDSQSKKRPRKELDDINDIKTEEEPPMKKIKIITSPITPILSQETCRY